MSDYNFSGKMFGGLFEITIYDSDPSLAQLIVEEAYEKAQFLSKIFNFYDPKSELSILNRKRKLKCSKELLYLITKSLEFSNLTQGAYDVSLGKSFLNIKTNGKPIETKCSYKDIKIYGKKVTLTNDDVMIDLGSIAKGYIIDNIADFLIDNGIEAGMVDGRGDIRMFGEIEKDIEIQHPRQKDKSILTVKVKDKAIATSGDYNQYRHDYNKSHLLNNKTFSSVTVITDTLEKADLFATLIAVIDISQIDKLLNIDKDLKVITIDKHLHIENWPKIHI